MNKVCTVVLDMLHNLVNLVYKVVQNSISFSLKLLKLLYLKTHFVA